jgi:MOSC domain-containing protein YiiM
MNEQHGLIRALAIHVSPSEPMRELESAEVATGLGLADDPDGKGERGITLLSWEQWEEVRVEMGISLPWTTRRANVLVEGFDLRTSVGTTLQLGDILLRVCDETRPCQTMERAQAGLLVALKPDLRGGVVGEVITGGHIKIGDIVKTA